MNDRVAYYMGLHYPIELLPDPDGGYVAEHPDLPGCIAQGKTANEAVEALKSAMGSRYHEGKLGRVWHLSEGRVGHLREGESGSQYLCRPWRHLLQQRSAQRTYEFRRGGPFAI